MVRSKKVLFICGSLNQTLQMRAIANELTEYEQRFTPYYGTGMTHVGVLIGLAESTIGGAKRTAWCFDYLRSNGLPIDYRGKEGPYDLVVTCSDTILPRNIWASKIALVQEGAVDPDTWEYQLVSRVHALPRWFAGTSMTGLSDAYDRFCVASEGFRDFFIGRGVDGNKIRVTGIPNFDDCARFRDSDFPYRDYVLVCTSDLRELARTDDRPAFIRRALRIAAGRQLIFKLHPNELVERATREIKELAPHALIFASGNAEHMVANAKVVVTQWSSLVYVALALGKEVFTNFDLASAKHLLPIQNGGSSAKAIAQVCRELLEDSAPTLRQVQGLPKVRPLSFLRIDQ